MSDLRVPVSTPSVRLSRYGWAACAAVALALAALSDLTPHRVWGVTAALGYGAAALTARRAVAASRAVAVAGAVVLPLGVLVATGLAQLEVVVVERSGQLLWATGSPYLPAPSAVADFNPYLPGMAAFGLLPGDGRWWTGAVFAGAALAAAGGGGRRDRTAWLMACPVVALPLCVGGTDLPVVGLMCLGIALAGQGRSWQSGLVLGAAAALKWTAWPALPVAFALLAVRNGGRPAARFAAVALGTAAVAVAPFAFADPGGFYANVVAFPLGLGTAASPATSPLPGHLLAAYVPGGTVIALSLLAVSALLLAASLFVRPPLTVLAAADRLALGLGLATSLMPATRFGYLVYPLVLWALPRCARSVPASRKVPA
ncbi:glycosyltransferase 87 family protein [Streptomyces flavidovirens]|uniref:glycosyltransferase 87 family protein n=1 Tax=Streptomyces flavidovirens TaxID=67298 RepID=UPI000D12367F|nr:glycosyltransferase 87 family protein [Streptomyces flavidovirens]